jgi:hypothetical protein
VSEPRSRAAVAVGFFRGLRGHSRRRDRASRWRRLMTSVVLVLFVAGGTCRPINPNEDARIEAEIKARLVAEKNANLTRLGVLSTGASST